MNFWLHRISHHAETSYPLLEKGYLSIGFVDFRYPEFIPGTLAADGWGFLESAFQEMWGSIPRTRYNLWRFIAEMQKSDWVLVPSRGTFSIFQIEDNAKPIGLLADQELQTWNGELLTMKDHALHNGKMIDLGFFRKVTPIAIGISRHDFADSALTSRMKHRATNAKITDLADSVHQALEAFRKNRPINLHSEILRASRDQVLGLIRDKLTPDKFEKLLGWYFQQVGATEVTYPAKNESGKEGDADVVAVFEPLKTIYFVQAKHHKWETSDWATQQIKEYRDQKNEMDDGYSKIPWVISSGDGFSEEAHKLARENAIALFSGQDLAQMILEAGIVNLDKVFR